jgi:hypothetical protein
MGDVMLLMMIQTEIPAKHVGKIYSVRMVSASVGASLGFAVSIPAFTFISVQWAIVLSATLFIGIGIAGLVRFGVR